MPGYSPNYGEKPEGRYELAEELRSSRALVPGDLNNSFSKHEVRRCNTAKCAEHLRQQIPRHFAPRKAAL